jgi:hypothetical protein
MAVVTTSGELAIHGRRKAVITAAATFGFGFVAMALYSLTGPAFGPVPTLWQSWGGTVGDIALPFLVYGLLRGVQALGPGCIHVSTYVVSGLGGLAGAACQAFWLLDPEPYVNWMVVAPHTFSPIGWYHFGYLVVVAGFVAGTAWELLVRARARGRAVEDPGADPRLRLVLGSRATTATAVGALVFAVAVAADAVTSLDSMASVGTTLGALAPLLITLAVALAMLGRRARLLIRPLVTAAAITSGLVVMAWMISKVG